MTPDIILDYPFEVRYGGWTHYESNVERAADIMLRARESWGVKMHEPIEVRFLGRLILTNFLPYFSRDGYAETIRLGMEELEEDLHALTHTLYLYRTGGHR